MEKENLENLATIADDDLNIEVYFDDPLPTNPEMLQALDRLDALQRKILTGTFGIQRSVMSDEDIATECALSLSDMQTHRTQAIEQLNFLMRFQSVIDQALDESDCSQQQKQLVSDHVRRIPQVIDTHRPGIPLTDPLIKECLRMMCTGASKFDAHATYDFWHYIQWWIAQTILTWK